MNDSTPPIRESDDAEAFPTEGDPSSDRVAPPPQPASKPSASRPVYGRLSRLCAKELRETLRDRRTIVTLVLMPLLVYPLLSIAFQKFFLTSMQPSEERICVVAAESEADVNRLRSALDFADSLVRNREELLRDERAGEREPESHWLASNLPPRPKISWGSVENPAQYLADLTIDLAVLLEPTEPRPGLPDALNPPLRCKFVVRKNSPAGEAALSYIESRLQLLNGSYLEARLAEAGVPWILPVTLDQESVETEGGDGFSLATLIPLILILMTITGAVYPAIDLTAGERERGTLESLIASPVPRWRLLSAKYTAVLTVALLTASVNLLSMMITITATGLSEVLFGPEGVTFLLVASICGLMMLFAAFFSALLLAITSVARSFKEAQAYLIPLMVVAIAPGFLSLMPNIEFTTLLAVVPLVNIALLARDMLQQGATPTLAAVTIISTAFYAFAAIGLAARVFGSDAILYGSKGNWSDLWRRSEKTADAPAVDTALLCLACLFPCYFVVTGWLAQLSDLSMFTRLGLSAVVTATLFGIFPVVACRVTSVSLRRGLQFRRTRLPFFLAAGLLGIGLWPFAYELFMLNRSLGWIDLDSDRFEQGRKLVEAFGKLSPIWIVFTLAIVPAFFEELFFRGFLFGALKSTTRPVVAIVASALLFGGFHVVASDLLAERLLPSTFLGLILATICYVSSSVWPGILLHTIHNGLMVLATRYPAILESWGLDLESEVHLPVVWLIGGACIVGLAGVVVQREIKPRR